MPKVALLEDEIHKAFTAAHSRDLKRLLVLAILSCLILSSLVFINLYVECQLRNETIDSQKHTQAILGAIQQQSALQDQEIHCIAAAFAQRPSSEVTAGDLSACHINWPR